MKKYTIGVDYGSDSVRSVLVDVRTGSEIASHVFYYPRWKEGKYCDPVRNQFRQHPLDYIEGLQKTIRKVVQKAGPKTAMEIGAISIDTTGSTPVAADEKGIPLAMHPQFAENPNAMFVLWKDHTAVGEADEINVLARSWGGEDYTKFEGGIYSSEWFWAKILKVMRDDESVRKAAYTWVEHCDWIPALLTGVDKAPDIKRSRCAAGHKAMWHGSWDGLPSEEFLVKLDPMLKGVRNRLYKDTHTVDEAAGTITKEWADKLGLKEDVIIGVGAFDAHLGAVGAEIKPYYLCKVMGTSTCDMITAPEAELGDSLVQGICGQVDGSIIPGMIGLEAGQSAFGDVYAWFKQLLLWPAQSLIAKSLTLDSEAREALIAELDDQLIPALSEAAAKIPVEESAELALDWFNGRRTPDANQNLKGALSGLNLGSDAPRVFRALVESTAFGAKAIADRFINEGVPINGIIAIGGVAKKSSFVMQVMADVLNKPILVARSEQTCALGSAMAAAVAGGIYKDLEDAKKRMGNGFETEYKPDPDMAAKYQTRYDKYMKFGKFIENELTKNA